MVVHFIVSKDRMIHSFEEYGESWDKNKAGIDKCSICGLRAAPSKIIHDTFAFRTRFRTYTMCRKLD